MSGCLAALLTFAVLVLIASAPATWFLMLLLGNMEVRGGAMSYIDCIPGGILIAMVVSRKEKSQG